MTSRISAKSGTEKGPKRQKSTKSRENPGLLFCKPCVFSYLRIFDALRGVFLLVFRLQTLKTHYTTGRIQENHFSNTHPSKTTQGGAPALRSCERGECVTRKEIPGLRFAPPEMKMTARLAGKAPREVRRYRAGFMSALKCRPPKRRASRETTVGQSAPERRAFLLRRVTTRLARITRFFLLATPCFAALPFLVILRASLPAASTARHMYQLATVR